MTERDDAQLLEAEDSLATLHISKPTTTDEPPEPNPWQDSTHNILEVSVLANNTLEGMTKSSDVSALDPSTAKGLAAELVAVPDEEGESRQEILQEFDPLANHEEKAAKTAWESSDSNPPSIAPVAHPVADAPPPPAPTTHAIDLSHPSSPSLPSFPSLAALARTFALPLTSRQRPRSLDTATAVPSPATLSSFASQQQQQQPRAIQPASDSGRSTPTRIGKANDGDPLQFDFQKFLDQMKLKSAEPVAKYLRSFLSNFAKRTFTVNDQVKLINDFLVFISAKMHETDLWRSASDAEFENAMEGMEKLVMNRLYDFTFTPQVIRMIPPRPVTTDDLERDRVLSQRIALFRWIEAKHLDIPEEHGSEGFLMFAQQELLKINHYKAPRDKLICILNCCKVIFGLIRHLRKEEGADSFIPLLIYVVLKANPEHLLSNVEFINRFRNPAKLQSEAGYYLSSLMGAVSFIETMDHTSLSSITQEEFEKNVEDAIQSLPSTGAHTPEPGTPVLEHVSNGPSTSIPLPSSHTGEESAQPLALPVPTQTISEDARRLLQKTGDTISKPLSAIGRIFNEVLDGAEESLASFTPFELGKDQPDTPQTVGDAVSSSAQQRTPYKPRIRRQPSPNSATSSEWHLPIPEDTPTRPHIGLPHTNQPLSMGPSQPTARLQAPRVQSLLLSERDLYSQSPHVSRTPTPNLDFVGMQQEIDRVHESAASASRETLRQIFPTMDPEIMDLVLEANGGDLGKSIEALLEMSSGT